MGTAKKLIIGGLVIGVPLAAMLLSRKTQAAPPPFSEEWQLDGAATIENGVLTLNPVPGDIASAVKACGAPQDFSAKDFSLWLLDDGHPNGAYLTVGFYSGSEHVDCTAQWIFSNITGVGGLMQFAGNTNPGWTNSGWINIKLPRGGPPDRNYVASSGWTPEMWAHITAIEIVLSGNADHSPLHLRDFQPVASPSKGAVTFIFEGGFYNQTYTQAKAILDRYRMKATWNINAGTLGGTTIAQLKECFAAGWDVGNYHGFSYTTPDGDWAGFEQNLLQNMAWLEANGLVRAAKIWDWAGGSNWTVRGEANVQKLVEILHRNGINIIQDSLNQWGQVNTLPPAVCPRVEWFRMANDQAMEVKVNRLRIAAQYKQWVPMFAHSIGPDGSFIRQEDFASLVQLISSLGLDVLTFSDIINRYPAWAGAEVSQ